MYVHVLSLVQQIGFCVYFGIFLTYAIHLIFSSRETSRDEKILKLRSFQHHGVILGLSLGFFIYSSVILYYLKNQHFELPNELRDIFGLCCFFLAWVHNTYIEIWGLEPLRKSELEVLSLEERELHTNKIPLVQKNIVIQAILLILVIWFHIES